MSYTNNIGGKKKKKKKKNQPLPLASPQASPMKDKRKTWVRKSSTGGTSIYSFAT